VEVVQMKIKKAKGCYHNKIRHSNLHLLRMLIILSLH
jgi:hypothetical protein